MKSPNLMRTILASAAVAALISPTLRATAAELKPLVVIGIPHDSVAIKHPVPAYPRNAHVLRIDGIVRLLVQVERGEIMNITAQSGPPLLAHFSVRWVRNTWQFKPSTSGQYILPISYTLSS
jgi:Gram-negative bacterial TonB protein C-terminal